MRPAAAEGVAVSAPLATGLDPVELGKPLPRGRHGIPRAEVIANQRQRLLRAAALEIRAQGYASLSVGEIAARAGVSRLTFYELFDDKADCVLAAHEDAVERLEALIVASYRAEPSWATGVAAATATLLDFALAAPDLANLVLSAGAANTEPEIARRGQQAIDRLAAAMHEANPSAERSASLALREQAAIGGLSAVIGAKLIAGEAEWSAELREELIQLILAPYIGDEQAKEIAAAA
jgi:AcrR family transcriptional regulator